MQILKDLYLIGGSLNGLTWSGSYGNYEDCNTYLLKGEDGCILFDCGNGDSWPQLVENMGYWGFKPADIRACFLTHAHLDHAGAAHILQKAGVRLFANRHTAEALALGDERCAGYLYHKEFTPCQVTHSLADEESITVSGLNIKARHFPGHTAGCTAYFFKHEGRQLVVSGDIIGTLLAGYFGWDGSFDFDKKTYLSSLQSFAQEDFDIMLSGHGLIHYGRPKVRVEEALSMALSSWR